MNQDHDWRELLHYQDCPSETQDAVGDQDDRHPSDDNPVENLSNSINAAASKIKPGEERVVDVDNSPQQTETAHRDVTQVSRQHDQSSSVELKMAERTKEKVAHNIGKSQDTENRSDGKEKEHTSENHNMLQREEEHVAAKPDYSIAGEHTEKNLDTVEDTSSPTAIGEEVIGVTEKSAQQVFGDAGSVYLSVDVQCTGQPGLVDDKKFGGKSNAPEASPEGVKAELDGEIKSAEKKIKSQENAHGTSTGAGLRSQLLPTSMQKAAVTECSLEPENEQSDQSMPNGAGKPEFESVRDHSDQGKINLDFKEAMLQRDSLLKLQDIDKLHSIEDNSAEHSDHAQRGNEINVRVSNLLSTRGSLKIDRKSLSTEGGQSEQIKREYVEDNTQYDKTEKPLESHIGQLSTQISKLGPKEQIAERQSSERKRALSDTLAEESHKMQKGDSQQGTQNTQDMVDAKALQVISLEKCRSQDTVDFSNAARVQSYSAEHSPDRMHLGSMRRQEPTYKTSSSIERLKALDALQDIENAQDVARNEGPGKSYRTQEPIRSTHRAAAREAWQDTDHGRSKQIHDSMHKLREVERMHSIERIHEMRSANSIPSDMDHKGDKSAKSILSGREKYGGGTQSRGQYDIEEVRSQMYGIRQMQVTEPMHALKTARASEKMQRFDNAHGALKPKNIFDARAITELVLNERDSERPHSAKRSGEAADNSRRLEKPSVSDGYRPSDLERVLGADKLRDFEEMQNIENLPVPEKTSHGNANKDWLRDSERARVGEDYRGFERVFGPSSAHYGGKGSRFDSRPYRDEVHGTEREHAMERQQDYGTLQMASRGGIQEVDRNSSDGLQDSAKTALVLDILRRREMERLDPEGTHGRSDVPRTEPMNTIPADTRMRWNEERWRDVEKASRMQHVRDEEVRSQQMKRTPRDSEAIRQVNMLQCIQKMHEMEGMQDIEKEDTKGRREATVGQKPSSISDARVKKKAKKDESTAKATAGAGNGKAGRGAILSLNGAKPFTLKKNQNTNTMGAGLNKGKPPMDTKLIPSTASASTLEASNAVSPNLPKISKPFPDRSVSNSTVPLEPEDFVLRKESWEVEQDLLEQAEAPTAVITPKHPALGKKKSKPRKKNISKSMRDLSERKASGTLGSGEAGKKRTVSAKGRSVSALDPMVPKILSPQVTTKRTQSNEEMQKLLYPAGDKMQKLLYPAGDKMQNIMEGRKSHVVRQSGDWEYELEMDGHVRVARLPGTSSAGEQRLQRTIYGSAEEMARELVPQSQSREHVPESQSREHVESHNSLGAGPDGSLRREQKSDMSQYNPEIDHILGDRYEEVQDSSRQNQVNCPPFTFVRKVSPPMSPPLARIADKGWSFLDYDPSNRERGTKLADQTASNTKSERTPSPPLLSAHQPRALTTSPHMAASLMAAKGEDAMDRQGGKFHRDRERHLAGEQMGRGNMTGSHRMHSRERGRSPTVTSPCATKYSHNRGDGQRRPQSPYQRELKQQHYDRVNRPEYYPGQVERNRSPLGDRIVGSPRDMGVLASSKYSALDSGMRGVDSNVNTIRGGGGKSGSTERGVEGAAQLVAKGHRKPWEPRSTVRHVSVGSLPQKRSHSPQFVLGNRIREPFVRRSISAKDTTSNWAKQHNEFKHGDASDAFMGGMKGYPGDGVYDRVQARVDRLQGWGEDRTGDRMNDRERLDEAPYRHGGMRELDSYPDSRLNQSLFDGGRDGGKSYTGRDDEYPRNEEMYARRGEDALPRGVDFYLDRDMHANQQAHLTARQAPNRRKFEPQAKPVEVMTLAPGIRREESIYNPFENTRGKLEPEERYTHKVHAGAGFDPHSVRERALGGMSAGDKYAATRETTESSKYAELDIYDAKVPTHPHPPGAREPASRIAGRRDDDIDAMHGSMRDDVRGEMRGNGLGFHHSDPADRGGRLDTADGDEFDRDRANKSFARVGELGEERAFLPPRRPHSTSPRQPYKQGRLSPNELYSDAESRQERQRSLRELEYQRRQEIELLRQETKMRQLDILRRERELQEMSRLHQQQDAQDLRQASRSQIDGFRSRVDREDLVNERTAGKFVEKDEGPRLINDEAYRRHQEVYRRQEDERQMGSSGAAYQDMIDEDQRRGPHNNSESQKLGKALPQRASTPGNAGEAGNVNGTAMANGGAQGQVKNGAGNSNPDGTDHLTGERRWLGERRQDASHQQRGGSSQLQPTLSRPPHPQGITSAQTKAAGSANAQSLSDREKARLQNFAMFDKHMAKGPVMFKATDSNMPSRRGTETTVADSPRVSAYRGSPKEPVLKREVLQKSDSCVCQWDECGLRCRSGSALLQHIWQHINNSRAISMRNGEGVHPCFWHGCRERFNTTSALSKHVSIHVMQFDMDEKDNAEHTQMSGAKNGYALQCAWSGCGKVCRSAIALTQHTAMHLADAGIAPKSVSQN
ncbi:hypothetical protein SARC_07568 [Sphaeroforma arctica JP610]|uniref:C2H2-type domain-containing protein n=1 Tax=Sphaeroforma arctica JP610 TaxID=667725 RepID=A0A0L0FTT1_9EUKA|nr:hypothetical protein SARC_07568 [Sphaeroforma arctica JP610]KNC80059.1 hypothetical protein SARC_07568 [Sphaeroforma arctica JP610]|eukprot:XP_014153961.1 hypothetical protein SARC_07568 [Sphaeroforma arctica JP610]